MISVLRDGLTERKNINLLDDKGIYDQCQESFLFLNKQPQAHVDGTSVMVNRDQSELVLVSRN